MCPKRKEKEKEGPIKNWHLALGELTIDTWTWLGEHWHSWPTYFRSYFGSGKWNGGLSHLWPKTIHNNNTNPFALLDWVWKMECNFGLVRKSECLHKTRGTHNIWFACSNRYNSKNHNLYPISSVKIIFYFTTNSRERNGIGALHWRLTIDSFTPSLALFACW